MLQKIGRQNGHLIMTHATNLGSSMVEAGKSYVALQAFPKFSVIPQN